MACYRPIVAYRGASLSDAGKRPIVFDRRKAVFAADDKRFPNERIPCGQCIGCRLEYSRQWAIRCDHEAKLHRFNSFVTLTYSDEYVPPNGSLERTHVQNFLKRLRYYSGSSKVRYFGCGEYGELTARPHYHLILFNCRFADAKLFSTRNGHDVFHSETLNDVWSFGRCEIGSVTFDSAAYVARYCVSKVTGEGADAHYKGRLPEFSMMSLKPGIGARFFEKYCRDIYPNDFVVVNGHRTRPPAYYDTLLERSNPALHALVMSSRLPQSVDAHAKAYHDRHASRLKVREEVAASRLKARSGDVS